MQTVLYLLFWAGLFFVMMRFGCGAHMGGHHRHSSHGDAGDERGLQLPSESRDPVCGMTVQTAGAKTSVWQGKAYYFCSNDCRDKFEAAPQSWLDRPASANSETGVHREGMGHGTA